MRLEGDRTDIARTHVVAQPIARAASSNERPIAQQVGYLHGADRAPELQCGRLVVCETYFPGGVRAERAALETHMIDDECAVRRKVGATHRKTPKCHRFLEGARNVQGECVADGVEVECGERAVGVVFEGRV